MLNGDERREFLMKLPRLNSEGKWDNFYKWDEFYRDKVIYNYLFCGKNHREEGFKDIFDISSSFFV